MADTSMNNNEEEEEVEAEVEPSPASEVASERILLLTQIRKRQIFGPAVRQLFQVYDIDLSKSLDAQEVRQMMLDCITNEDKVLTPEESVNFLRVILGEESDELEDADLLVNEDQFTLFMLNGMVKPKLELKEFSQRSIVHRKLYLFIT